MDVTLDMLLNSRDTRYQLQQEILRFFPQHTLLCLTVIMPGAVKRNRLSLTIANAAIDAIPHSFNLAQEWQQFALPSDSIIIKKSIMARDLITGYEAYMLTTLPPTEAKRTACELEESHPWGRLFDLDVIGHDGIPVSRENIGLSPRRCLLCNHEARYCMRNHTHTPEDIQAYITTIINQGNQTSSISSPTLNSRLPNAHV